MSEHELKTWPEPFAAILAGTKRHEIRKADRPFAVGDVLHLREWAPTEDAYAFGPRPGSYTGRDVRVVVTYLTPGGAWGLPADLCVISIKVAAPRCSCTSEAGDSRCDRHPTCNECGEPAVAPRECCADHGGEARGTWMEVTP